MTLTFSYNSNQAPYYLMFPFITTFVYRASLNFPLMLNLLFSRLFICFYLPSCIISVKYISYFFFSSLFPYFFLFFDCDDILLFFPTTDAYKNVSNTFTIYSGSNGKCRIRKHPPYFSVRYFFSAFSANLYTLQYMNLLSYYTYYSSGLFLLAYNLVVVITYTCFFLMYRIYIVD
jgi:hypothetical protein